MRLPIRRPEPLLLGMALLAAIGLWLFIAVAEEVSEGETGALDRAILLAMRDPANLQQAVGPAWLDQAARDITALGSTSVLSLLVLLVVLFLWLLGRRGMALYVLVSTSVGAGLSFLLKALFQRPRPNLFPHGDTVLTASFPSGHAMISTLVYLTLGVLLARLLTERRLEIFVVLSAMLVALLVGLSRIYLGVHWPTDVLAGWAGGASWALLCWTLAMWVWPGFGLRSGR
ncbi:phosphatase PAP2 family protein [Brachymonas chironomi]|uniref:phosphatase PAP2 family protein n=1 Tax=Brachymonas chironomi TaxID=491919 RepID=UPI0003627BDA|nr:phosphatase PAP2 family protein [Brachymonas chironomi]